ncbi:uncharacterized protein LOC127260194 [Andrographis paniculata]|uniref:uncharacterized protein LOC127260194 n=1 Tax=Andrographis paniculata TaxID=175694 RepID=UPI0021E81742|nr:uncharacterized protein LOC127260194 [Andrographis paniculata]
MAYEITRLRCICCILALVSLSSSSLFLHWSYFSDVSVQENSQDSISLLAFPSAWNNLDFPSLQPPARFLRIALFVKKWPEEHQAGGLERHASTLHLRLARRGHEVHVFTSSPGSGNSTLKVRNLYFHLSKPTSAGYLDQAMVWSQFRAINLSRHFDVVHTESVALMHTRSRDVSNLVVSWHGIAYESIHSDIIQENLRSPNESQSLILTQRVAKVVEEVKFFPRYAHHVATSDHAGDILRRVYMLPEERVHVILNGVDEDVFKPMASDVERFKSKYAVCGLKNSSLILGLAGRLVKDKGHPLIFKALRQIFEEDSSFREGVVVLVAGDGPWGDRYRSFGDCVRVLGPLDQAELARFYNTIDIFVNPTLRAQGLDHTLLEAMLVGKPVMATRLASIAGSVIVGEVGYMFSPSVEALKKALYRVWQDGRASLKLKGQLARRRALRLFTATKMAAAYERLFLCIDEQHQGAAATDYCTYKCD